MKSNWLDVDTEYLIEFYEKGYSYSDLADKLDRTEKQIAAKLRHLSDAGRITKEARKKHKSLQKIEMAKDWELGQISIKAISLKYGCSTSGVQKAIEYANREGLISARKTRPKPKQVVSWTAQDDKTLIDATYKGVTYKQLAKLFGRSEESIFYRVRVLKSLGRLPNKGRGYFTRLRFESIIEKWNALPSRKNYSCVEGVSEKETRDAVAWAKRCGVPVKHVRERVLVKITPTNSVESRLYSAWDQTEVELLKVYRYMGKTVKEIARLLGRTPGSVLSAIRKFDAPRRG